MLFDCFIWTFLYYFDVRVGRYVKIQRSSSAHPLAIESTHGQLSGRVLRRWMRARCRAEAVTLQTFTLAKKHDKYRPKNRPKKAIGDGFSPSLINDTVVQSPNPI